MGSAILNNNILYTYIASGILYHFDRTCIYIIIITITVIQRYIPPAVCVP